MKKLNLSIDDIQSLVLQLNSCLLEDNPFYPNPVTIQDIQGLVCDIPNMYNNQDIFYKLDHLSKLGCVLYKQDLMVFRYIDATTLSSDDVLNTREITRLGQVYVNYLTDLKLTVPVIMVDNLGNKQYANAVPNVKSVCNQLVSCIMSCEQLGTEFYQQGSFLLLARDVYLCRAYATIQFEN